MRTHFSYLITDTMGFWHILVCVLARTLCSYAFLRQDVRKSRKKQTDNVLPHAIIRVVRILNNIFDIVHEQPMDFTCNIIYEMISLARKH